MKSFSCMPAVQTPEAPRDTRHLRIPGSRLPLEVIGSATPTDYDIGANTPFTFVPACKPPCLRFAVTVTGHHARLGTQLLAKLYRGGHPRPPNSMRFPRRNASNSRHLMADVRFRADFVCFTPSFGRSEHSRRTSAFDPQETFERFTVNVREWLDQAILGLREAALSKRDEAR